MEFIGEYQVVEMGARYYEVWCVSCKKVTVHHMSVRTICKCGHKELEHHMEDTTYYMTEPPYLVCDGDGVGCDCHEWEYGTEVVDKCDKCGECEEVGNKS